MASKVIHSKVGYVHAPCADQAFVVGPDGQLLWHDSKKHYAHNDVAKDLDRGMVARGTIDDDELQLFAVHAWETASGVDATTEGYITEDAAKAVVEQVLKLRDDIRTVWFEFWNAPEFIGDIQEGMERLLSVENGPA